MPVMTPMKTVCKKAMFPPSLSANVCNGSPSVPTGWKKRLPWRLREEGIGLGYGVWVDGEKVPVLPLEEVGQSRHVLACGVKLHGPLYGVQDDPGVQIGRQGSIIQAVGGFHRLSGHL